MQMDNGHDLYGEEEDYGNEDANHSDNNTALNLKWVMGFNKDID